MKFCENCGAKNANDATFCSECGTRWHVNNNQNTAVRAGRCTLQARSWQSAGLAVPIT